MLNAHAHAYAYAHAHGLVSIDALTMIVPYMLCKCVSSSGDPKHCAY